ncbi:MAG: hypothetical protein JRC77_04675 [Deltaproteobacteria bacterium]|nr:hypothetical protein [Deltaproteobacteria bacterium]
MRLVKDEISKGLVLLTDLPLIYGFQVLSNSAGGRHKEEDKADPHANKTCHQVFDAEGYGV